ncbi:MAG: hypothetical protein ACSHXY_07775 [Alphaproteobacteria bacterium]
MSENEAKSFAAASSGKSAEEVAFELLNKLKGQGVWGERNASAILDMYAECLDAAKGLRVYEGQNRVDAPIKAPGKSAAQVPPMQTQPLQARPTQSQMVQAQPVQAQPIQAQPLQAQAPQHAQPVHAQQQILNQAYGQS